MAWRGTSDRAWPVQNRIPSTKRAMPKRLMSERAMRMVYFTAASHQADGGREFGRVGARFFLGSHSSIYIMLGSPLVARLRRFDSGVTT